MKGLQGLRIQKRLLYIDSTPADVESAIEVQDAIAQALQQADETTVNSAEFVVPESGGEGFCRVYEYKRGSFTPLVTHPSLGARPSLGHSS